MGDHQLRLDSDHQAIRPFLHLPIDDRIGGGDLLSTFILISQNRASAAADRRADLDLQIGLLAEHEVTHLITLTKRIAEHLGLKEAANPELDELGRNVAPEAVLERIERTQS